LSDRSRSGGKFLFCCANQFNVPRRHEWTHANRNGAAGGVRCDWALIRRVVRIALPISKRLKSTASNLWKSPPLLTACDCTIEVNREIKVRRECSTERPRRHHRAVLAPARTERDQRNNVNRTDSRMHSATSATLPRGGEINRCDCKSCQCTRRKCERISLSHIGVDAAIVITVVVHVEELDSW
jgi:hypothetical protein